LIPGEQTDHSHVHLNPVNQRIFLSMTHLPEVPNILISGGKVFTIKLDNNATSNHFQGQPIYGVVESIKDADGNELLKAQKQAMEQKPK